MSVNPKVITPEVKISEAEEILVQNKIKAVLVAENNQLRGVFEYNGIL